MRPTSRLAQADLFEPSGALPDGFEYREDAISVDEESTLVAWFASLPFAPFEFHGYLGRRRTVSFGWRYDYAGARLRPAEELPSELEPLRDRAARLAGQPAKSLQHTHIIEYSPGAGIGWHRDKPQFGEVVGISLLAPCVLRFRRRCGTRWERRSQRISPRSAYLLQGASRHDWQHSIVAMDRLRYSVTFRTLASGVSD